jgi:two-component system sensor histidine kinase AlgZ
MTDPTRHAFLPNFCAIRSVFAVVVSAELLAFVLTLSAFPPASGFWAELSLRSLYIQWIALSVAALFCVLHRPLAGLSHALAGLLAWLTILLTTSVVFFAAMSLGLVPAGSAALIWLQHLAIAGIVGAVLLRYLYEQHRERQREVAESQARYEALQARIRPHFLFNSMNTIASLTRSDPDLAEQVVHDLSDLFRATLTDSAALSTLADEFELSRGYLRIEQQRLGERLQTSWDVAVADPAIRVPPLLLQPLLENAVYHGVEPSTGGAQVAIRARRDGEKLVLSIENTLADQPLPVLRRGNQLAQDNVRQRLEAVFGEAAEMRVCEQPDAYRVELHLPLGQR